MSKTEFITLFTPPFRYIQDPPSVVDACGRPLLEIRGFSMAKDHAEGDGEKACDIQDEYGENLASEHTKRYEYLVGAAKASTALRDALVLVEECMGSSLYQVFLERAFDYQNRMEEYPLVGNVEDLIHRMVYLHSNTQNQRVGSWSEILNICLRWSGTPEGHDFWAGWNEKVLIYIRERS